MKREKEDGTEKDRMKERKNELMCSLPGGRAS